MTAKPALIRAIGAPGIALVAINSMIGFEAGTIVSGEAKTPRRTVPGTIVLTVAATTILYFLIMLVYVSVLPESDRDGKTLADVGRVLAGSAGAVVIALAAVFSIGGNLAANMLSVSVDCAPAGIHKHAAT